MIEATEKSDCSRAHIRLRMFDKLKDKVERVNVATKDAKENKIDANPIT